MPFTTLRLCTRRCARTWAGIATRHAIQFAALSLPFALSPAPPLTTIKDVLYKAAGPRFTGVLQSP